MLESQGIDCSRVTYVNKHPHMAGRREEDARLEARSAETVRRCAHLDSEAEYVRLLRRVDELNPISMANTTTFRVGALELTLPGNQAVGTFGDSGGGSDGTPPWAACGFAHDGHGDPLELGRSIIEAGLQAVPLPAALPGGVAVSVATFLSDSFQLLPAGMEAHLADDAQWQSPRPRGRRFGGRLAVRCPLQRQQRLGCGNPGCLSPAGHGGHALLSFQQANQRRRIAKGGARLWAMAMRD